MRPLYHPSMDDVTVEGILYALSDPVRAAIFANIVSSGMPKACCAIVGSVGKTLPKSTLSQHFRVLREAGLIHSERKGVELQNTCRCSELQGRFGPLIQTIMQAYSSQLSEAAEA